MENLLFIVLAQSMVSVMLVKNLSELNSKDGYIQSLLLIFCIYLTYKTVLYFITPDGEVYHKLHGAFSLLYGPILFFYIMRTKRSQLKKWYSLVHFVPFVIVFSLNIYTLLSILFSEDLTNLNWYDQFSGFGIMLSCSMYAIYTFYYVIAQKKISGYEKIFVLLIAVVLLIPLNMKILSYFIAFGYEEMRMVWYGGILIMLIAVVYLKICSQKNQYLSIKEELLQQQEKIKEERSRSYAHSKLTYAEKQEIAEMLKEAMTLQKLYLDPDLSLESLAMALSVPKHHLTEVLNVDLGMNFYHYVNEFRIREATAQLHKNSGMSLLRLCYETGFKSKSTFNKYFKEITGYTPSEYREKNLLENC